MMNPIALYLHKTIRYKNILVLHNFMSTWHMGFEQITSSAEDLKTIKIVTDWFLKNL